MNEKSPGKPLIVQSSIINKQDKIKSNKNKIPNCISSYDSDEEFEKTKQNSNKILVRKLWLSL